MRFSEILLFLILFFAPSFKGLYYEQEMFIFQILVFITFAVFLVKNQKIKLTGPLDITILFFLATYLLSIPGAVDFREALLVVMRLLAYIMIYLLVSSITVEHNRRQNILNTIYLSGILLVLVTMLNIVGIITSAEVWVNPIIQTTFEYKNVGALFMLVCTLIGLYRWTQTTSVRIISFIGIGNYLYLVMILGTQSRAIWLLYPIACTLLLLGLSAGKRKSTFVKTMICILPAILISNKFLSLLKQDLTGQALLLVLGGAILTITGIIGWVQIEARFNSRVRTAIILISGVIGFLALAVLTRSSALMYKLQSISIFDFSIQERLVFFKDAWKIISENLFFGTGGRGWDILYLNIQSYGYFAENVHNDFVQVGVEAGLLGLLTFIALWIVFFLSGWKIYRTAEPSNKDTTWLILTIGVIIMIHTMFDFDMAHSAMSFLLWSLFGIIRAMDAIYPRNKTLPLKSGFQTVLRSPGLLTVLAAGLLYCGISLSFFTGDMFFSKGENLLKSGDLENSREYFLKAQSFDPWNIHIMLSLAQVNLVMFSLGNPSSLNEALNFAEKALTVRPNEPLIHSVYSTALFYKGDYAQSVAEAEKYVTLHPMLLTAYEILASTYTNAGIALLQQGANHEAADYFNMTLKVPNMIKARMSEVSPGEIKLWRKNNSVPVLSLTPRIKMYNGAANLLLGNISLGNELILAAALEDPASPDSMLWQAVVLNIQGKKNESRALLEQVSIQNPVLSQDYKIIENLIGRR